MVSKMAETDLRAKARQLVAEILAAYLCAEEPVQNQIQQDITPLIPKAEAALAAVQQETREQVIARVQQLPRYDALPYVTVRLADVIEALSGGVS